MIEPDQRPRVRQGVRGKDLGDEYVFYDADSDKVHVLNGTAREIYLRCNGTRSVAELVDWLVDRYEVDEEAAHRDVGEVLDRLLELGVVSLN